MVLSAVLIGLSIGGAYWLHQMNMAEIAHYRQFMFAHPEAFPTMPTPPQRGWLGGDTVGMAGILLFAVIGGGMLVYSWIMLSFVTIDENMPVFGIITSGGLPIKR
jgi:hypothetical protein